MRAGENTLIREEEIQAYVDGSLEPDRRGPVESYLSRQPAEAERVMAYRRQNILLHEAFDCAAEAPLSAPLEELKVKLADAVEGRRVSAQLRRWTTAAACLAVISGGAVFGYQNFFLMGNDPPAAFSRLAVEAHSLLTGEASPPLTEKGLEGGNALVAWLSQRETKTSRPAPVLKQFGLEISGGRIFLIGERPVVQLVYYGSKGHQKLSLYVGASPSDDQQNVFTFGQQGSLSTFYWRQPKLEFSLVGTMTRDELTSVAKAVHEQLNATGNSDPATVRHLNKVLAGEGSAGGAGSGSSQALQRLRPNVDRDQGRTLSKMPLVILENK